MDGTINWIITYVGAGPNPVVELYDVSPGADTPPIVIDIPCSPPVACPWPTQNLEYGDYKAAVRSGSNLYFFVNGVDPMTSPNAIGDGSTITLSPSHPNASVKIKVHV